MNPALLARMVHLVRRCNDYDKRRSTVALRREVNQLHAEIDRLMPTTRQECEALAQAVAERT